MGQLLILFVVALVAAALVFGVVSLITGGDPGLEPAEPDGMSTPLPVARPLAERDLNGVRFDTALRGYRMAQVDQALRRAAYDIGYKEELINVLEAEVLALRENRLADADALRAARESASRPAGAPGMPPSPGAPQPAEVVAMPADLVAVPVEVVAVPVEVVAVPVEVVAVPVDEAPPAASAVEDNDGPAGVTR